MTRHERPSRPEWLERRLSLKPGPGLRFAGGFAGSRAPLLRRGDMMARVTVVAPQVGHSSRCLADCMSNAAMSLNQPSNSWPSPQRKS